MKKIILLIFISFSFNIVHSQTIHLIEAIECKHKYLVDSEKDRENLTSLVNDIQNKIPHVKIKRYVLQCGTKLSKNWINAILNNIDENCFDDIIWFYYSGGNGFRYDNFPQVNGVPQTWVHKRLKQTRARLTLTLFDTCNHGKQMGAVKDYSKFSYTDSECNELSYNDNLNNYELLFLRSRGNIITCSSKQGELSYSLAGVGGVYSSNFFNSIQSERNWCEVGKSSKYNTEKFSTLNVTKQSPKFIWENAR